MYYNSPFVTALFKKKKWKLVKVTYSSDPCCITLNTPSIKFEIDKGSSYCFAKELLTDPLEIIKAKTYVGLIKVPQIHLDYFLNYLDYLIHLDTLKK